MSWTWVIKVADTSALSALMSLVEDGTLDELFLCQIDHDGAVDASYRQGDVLAILSSTTLEVRKALEQIADPIILDELPDTSFDIDEDGALLKGVTYPTSEEDEIALIESLGEDLSV